MEPEELESEIQKRIARIEVEVWAVADSVSTATLTSIDENGYPARLIDVEIQK